MTSPARAPRPTPRRIAQPAPTSRRDHLRVVPPPSRPSTKGRRTGAIVVVTMVVVFGSLMASAMFHGLLVSGQSNLDQLDTQLQEEQGSLAREKLELANLQSPERIAAEARRIGMVPAERQHWVSPVEGAEPIVTGEATEPVDPNATDQTDQTDQTTDTSGDELATVGTGADAQ